MKNNLLHLNFKKSVVLTIFIFLLTPLVYPNRLSQEATISHIIILPGTDLYTLWGHCAIRIKDPKLGIDNMYNWGTFDFNDPGFVLNFLNGTLNYFLSEERFSQSMWHYIYNEKRTLLEQKLHLDSITKQKIYDFIQQNLLLENKFYQYDFLYDNCATRITDLLDQTQKNNIKFPEYREESMSYRAYISKYLPNHPYLDFAFALLLGPKADQKTSMRESMFLPLPLMEGFDHANVLNNFRPSPLVNEKRTLHLSKPDGLKSPILSPLLVSWIILAIILLLTWSHYVIKNEKYKKYQTYLLKVFDSFLFLLIGFVGCLNIFLWFFSRHYITDYNLNLLFTLPTHFLIAFLIPFTKGNKFMRFYFIVTIILAIFSLIIRLFIYQFFHPAFLPIILLLIIRSYSLSKLELK